MRIVIAPDKFKGSLAAHEVAAAIARGIRRANPAIDIAQIPMADGGEGTVAALVAATGGGFMQRHVTGPLPEMKVDAVYGLCGDFETAVIEMSAASGLHLLNAQQRNPMKTTTYGTGELLLAAAESRVKRIILGIGGSATVDGGIGCAQACGVRFEFQSGRVIESDDLPLTGADVANVHLSRMESLAGDRLGDIEIIVASDVDNPLSGPRGAARVFGPQKGATPEQVELLDHALEQLAGRIPRGVELSETPGAGAAGGLGFGMMAFFGAKIRAGFGIIAEAARLRQRLAGADLCITGEGRLDASSMGGKTAIGVARMCKRLGVRCVALVGSVGEGAEAALQEGIAEYHSISEGKTQEESMRNAAVLLEEAAFRAVSSAG